MIKDISIIREELEGYEEVEFPYSFETDCSIKYITLKKKKGIEEESFYKGGEFNNMGNNCIFLKNKNRTWSVPICLKNKDGSTKYATRFFVREDEKKCDKQINELNETIQYQQSIIEKMTHKIATLELTKKQLSEERRNYEEMLQQNRFNLKQVAIESREKDEKIVKYEDIIKKLANSHQMFHNP